jgi:hypothetical protein
VAYTGGCLCGEIQFRIDSEPNSIQICHCTQCRKAQGGAFATNIPVDASALQFLSGEKLLKAYESSPGKERFFCSQCGSPVFSRRASNPSIIRLRAGLINEPLKAGLAWHAFTGSMCNWWTINDELPQYKEGYVPS